MSKIRTKFRCEQVTRTAYGDVIGFMVVNQGSEENKVFGKNTPSGEIQMRVEKDSEAYGEFEPGQEFYVDFSEAPKTVIPIPKMDN